MTSKKDRHVEPPDDWNREQQLDDGFNKLVLYQVLIKDETGSYGHVFHPEFLRFVRHAAKTIKTDEKLKTHFQNTVEELGEFGYVTAILLPKYLQVLKIIRGVTASAPGEGLSKIIYKSKDEFYSINWTEEQYHENTIIQITQTISRPHVKHTVILRNITWVIATV